MNTLRHETVSYTHLDVYKRQIEYDDEALLRHRRSIGTVFQAYNLFPHLLSLIHI